MYPWEFQHELSDIGLDILREHMILYLAMEERTGKSYTGLLIVEKSFADTALIITKAKAVGCEHTEEGWKNLLAKAPLEKQYWVTTYGKVTKKDLDRADIVIIDEAHNYISGYPKPSATWKKLKPLLKGKPIIYMSATPHAQGKQMLYHQFALSDWSPWNKYSNFYNWFNTYGIKRQIRLHGRWVNQYDRVDDELVEACVDHLFITKTRKELGFTQEPVDKIHILELSNKTKELYNNIIKDKVTYIKGGLLMLDSTIKLRSALHMIEGGGVKITLSQAIPDADKVEEEKLLDAKLYHNYIVLDNEEKIEYIKEQWGDNENIAIMYNYKVEAIKLERAFKHAKIYQATSYAEGIDLSHIEHLIIYSQDFSTARHTQRRARQANKERTIPIVVHFLLVKDAISDQVYDTVSINKQNFVDSRFERKVL